MLKSNLFGAFVVAIASFLLVNGESGNLNCVVDPAQRKECGAIGGSNNQQCLAAGCCWARATELGTPWCFTAAESLDKGYSIDANSFVETEFGLSARLMRNGPTNAVYGDDIANLSLDLYYETANRIRVKISDASALRWEVPQSVVSRPTDGKISKDLSDLTVSTTQSPFSFEVKRKSDGVVVFQSSQQLVFKDQYIELTSSFDPNMSTFGIGENSRTNHKLKSNTTYTLWAGDVMAAKKNVNLYSSYPFYIQKYGTGSTHGVFMLNSNGMDVTLLDSSITFRMIGGIIDLYIFSGPSPANVIQQYTELIGRPAMMPYWTLGFHSCRWGYESLDQVKEVVRNYSLAGIPLDTQWLDIDYMDHYRDFTADPVNFPMTDIAAFVDGLHANGQRFVPIIDPGIMVYPGYEAYEIGKQKGLYVKDLTGGYYQGQVWPGPVFYPDFLHPETQDYWTTQIKQFYDQVHNDGMWIDMNEVSNFCNIGGKDQVCVNNHPESCPDPNSDSFSSCCLTCETVDPTNKYDFPPYLIGHFWGRLSAHTMAMSATHYNNVSAYNAHNLYGLSEHIATTQAMIASNGKRPFVLTRSSFPSTGKHGAKWTGDNGATWADLKASIVGMLEFNMFGVPMVGSDICGFMLESNEELCARWIEVGAYYPFSRNHNTKKQPAQELYLWPTVTEAAKKALSLRYQLLPYMYTLFAEAHYHGTPVVRSLWMNFPFDEEALSIDGQFMLGANVLVSPVLSSGADRVTAYFPEGVWFPISAGNFSSVPLISGSSGRHAVLHTPLTDTNVHVRGGSILPLQQAASTTTQARQTAFTLLVSLNLVHSNASGALFWDDGEQLEIGDNYLHSHYSAEYNLLSKFGKISNTFYQNQYDGANGLVIDTIIVNGANLSCPESSSTILTINESANKNISTKCVEQDSLTGSNEVIDNVDVSNDKQVFHQLIFSGLNIPLRKEFTFVWASQK